jgi:hypothetical protein
MKKRVPISICILVFMAAPAMSAEPAGPTYLGFGSASCASWSSGRQAKTLVAFGQMGWVLGFLSGASLMEKITDKTGPDTLKDVDADAVLGWMDKYCSEHPLDRIAAAAVELQVTLRKKARE